MAQADFTLTGLDQLQRMQRFLDPRNFDKAQRAGITRASQRVRSQAPKEIGQRYAIRSARIKEDISRASIAPDGGSATIKFARRKPPTLLQYSGTEGKRATGQRGLGRGLGWSSPARKGTPFKATTFKPEGRREYRGVFVIPGANGNRVPVRQSGSQINPRTGRPKLRAVYGPSIGSIFLGNSAAGVEIRANVEREVSQAFVQGFEKKLRDLARGYGSR